ncbi:Clp protease N-terminal domain-containing protein [Streptomyces indicus]|uniref:Clp amino terminal domain-containing protein, pathogenicity island component n=1 Tax=Streptomyces indicus TaxID=417292 RepID=A0A1G9FB95_9ACTN|nr:Clp protease N-terminal domain-containing protein [Streptomyces indicus]SDK85621.1 Clp amino terminal domain-containing protein, pathogenicity island component [Streptomyces indicus]
MAADRTRRTPDRPLIRTPRYEQVLAEAERIAAGLGHDYVGVEHIFLAVLRDPAAVPTQVLAGIVDPVDVDEALSEVMRTYHR